MISSRNNMIIPLRESSFSEYVILNSLTGSFDLMNEQEYQLYLDFQKSGQINPCYSKFYEYLLERGYLFVDRQSEDAKIHSEYIRFQTDLTNSPTQILLIPSYGCNLACTYCYEKDIAGQGKLIDVATVMAFFEYLRRNFSAKKVKPYITLFGGEPLMDRPKQRRMIELILDNCNQEGFEVAVVTNGYTLAVYCQTLSEVKIKEIQVTLDGNRAVHDGRRGTLDGNGSFDRIIKGIDTAIGYRFPINLRTVLDYDNLADLVNLARFCNEKGWLDLGPERFKTQIGRNYELFCCYAKPEQLMSQVELWSEFVKLAVEYPLLKKYHRPDFKGIRYLVDTGVMYQASFDTCPAAKTEWVFDLNGDIYGCTASCGREEFKLGKFYPQISMETDRIKHWQSRNIFLIRECQECRHNLICGGGCGVVAAHRGGEILSPDCRPIQELIELGINYYRPELQRMAGSNQEFTTGCLICDQEPVYQKVNPD